MAKDGPRLCEDCDDPIDPARVTALPATRLCIKCAEEWEERFGGKNRKMEFVVRGMSAEDYDGYDTFITTPSRKRER